MPFRRQSLLDYIRETRVGKGNEGAISHLRSSVKTPRELMTETKLGRPRNYRIYGEAEFESIVTGERKKHWVSVYTNDDLTGDEFFTEVIDAHEESETDPEFAIRSAVKRRVDHFRGRPY